MPRPPPPGPKSSRTRSSSPPLLPPPPPHFPPPPAGLLLRLAYGLHHALEAVTPAHERLGGDVLVALGEIEAAAQQLEASTPVVPGRQAELGLERGAEQRAAVLIQLVPLDLDPVRRALAGLDVGGRGAPLLRPQRP